MRREGMVERGESVEGGGVGAGEGRGYGRERDR